MSMPRRSLHVYLVGIVAGIVMDYGPAQAVINSTRDAGG